MDRDAFDNVARGLAKAPSRRGVIGALLGVALAASLGAAGDARKRRGKRRGSKDGPAYLAAEATCASPGPSSNLSGCNFDGADLSGSDLSGSSMVGTTFRNAELAGTDLSSSTLRGAIFRGADLTCADLSSSALRNADFRGFPNPGRRTNLTLADLSSAGGCGSILANGRTVFCRTTVCDGSVRNDGCPAGVDPAALCCDDDDCPNGQSCEGGTCAPSVSPRLEVRAGPEEGCVTVFGAGLQPQSLMTAAALGSCVATFTVLTGADGGVTLEACAATEFCPNCPGETVTGVAAVGVAADGSPVQSEPFVLTPPVVCAAA
jgi:uncharacterized protein YjbI with pentapeptide repeats